MFVKCYKTMDDFDGIYQYLFENLFNEYYSLCSPGHLLLEKSKEESKEEFLSHLAHQAIYYLLRNLISDSENMLDGFNKIKSINHFFENLFNEKR